MKIQVINFGARNLPKRAHYNDAGADVYATMKCKIEPHSTAVLPLGFGLCIPDGYVGFVFPRSGLSSKGLTCELPPIDSGYRGQVHAILTNHSGEVIQINEDDRVGQLVILPVVLADFVTSLDEQRGVGAFGSTGI